MDVAATSHHFTYEGDSPATDLRQGDVLRRTEPLVSIFDQFHSYFKQEQYTAFMVLTQSCDLARRGTSPCNARYITLAAVRPTQIAISREIEAMEDEPLLRKAQVSSVKVRERIARLVEKIINNNEAEYFFLRAYAGAGLAEDSCAFLRLSVPIKIEHYDTCLAARMFSLSEPFQAKLGWLVGNIYSRVGTKDWPREQGSELVTELINESYTWVEDRRVREAVKKVTMGDKEPDALRSEILELAIATPREQVAEDVAKFLQKRFNLTPEEQEKIRKQVYDLSKIKQFLQV